MRPLMRLLLLTTLSLALGVALGFAAADDSKEHKFDALKRFSQVLELVERNYVRDVPRKDLFNGAIKGMLQGLDPHSTFMNPQEYKEMQETTSGEFSGIGIEISQENGQVIVVSPIEDTPAFRAGLQPGDIILSINGQPTQELTLQEVVSRIRGPKGSEVELSILHSDAKSPLTVRIVRDSIPLISVKSRELEDGYYWVRLTRFSERTSQELQETLKAAQQKGLKGILLDLRNNPGGLVDQSVAVADSFLREGTIVSIRGRDNVPMREYKAKPKKSFIDVPIVVLVNAGSASAAEIVAGALRDQKRAVLLGERTFGKGSVQNIIPLADGSGLKLTVALYYTPAGVSIQAQGIVPDMEVPFEPSRTEDKKPSRQQMREKDLSRHIESSPAKQDGQRPESSTIPKDAPKDVAKDASSPAAPPREPRDAKEQLEKDNQLRMGLQVLKTLPRMREMKS